MSFSLYSNFSLLGVLLKVLLGVRFKTLLRFLCRTLLGDLRSALLGDLFIKLALELDLLKLELFSLSLTDLGVLPELDANLLMKVPTILF